MTDVTTAVSVGGVQEKAPIIPIHDGEWFPVYCDPDKFPIMYPLEAVQCVWLVEPEKGTAIAMHFTVADVVAANLPVPIDCVMDKEFPKWFSRKKYTAKAFLWCMVCVTKVRVQDIRVGDLYNPKLPGTMYYAVQKIIQTDTQTTMEYVKWEDGGSIVCKSFETDDSAESERVTVIRILPPHGG